MAYTRDYVDASKLRDQYLNIVYGNYYVKLGRCTGTILGAIHSAYNFPAGAQIAVDIMAKWQQGHQFHYVFSETDNFSCNFLYVRLLADRLGVKMSESFHLYSGKVNREYDHRPATATLHQLNVAVSVNRPGALQGIDVDRVLYSMVFGYVQPIFQCFHGLAKIIGI